MAKSTSCPTAMVSDGQGGTMVVNEEDAHLYQTTAPKAKAKAKPKPKPKAKAR